MLEYLRLSYITFTFKALEALRVITPTTDTEPIYPFDSAISPYAAYIKEDMEYIADNCVGIGNKKRFVLRDGVFPGLAARMLPLATLKELLAFNKPLAHFFGIDDDYVEPEQLEEQRAYTLALLNGTTRNVSGDIFSLLTSFHDELLCKFPEEDKGHFLKAVDHYLEGVAREMPYKRPAKNGNRQWPTIEEYSGDGGIREMTAGQLIPIELLKYSLRGKGLAIPNEILYSESVGRLELLCGRMIGFCNDHYSYPREKKKGEPLNLRIIFEKEGLTPVEARSAALAIHDRDLARFLELQRDVNNLHPEMPRYTYELGRMLSGHKEWYLEDSKRYQGNNTKVRALTYIASRALADFSRQLF